MIRLLMSNSFKAERGEQEMCTSCLMLYAFVGQHNNTTFKLLGFIQKENFKRYMSLETQHVYVKYGLPL